MSLFHIHYSSQSLGKQSGMYAVVPDGDGPFNVVYMLHGLSDDYTMWLRRTCIERYADTLGIMVVLLDGDRSFYTDLPSSRGNYEQHILESVRFIDRTFHTVDSPDARGIGGLSMGGYGSMKIALKHPDVFGSVASHSGVVQLQHFRHLNNSEELRSIFGDGINEDEDCFALAARPGKKPAIYIDCGHDDFLIEENRQFHAHLVSLGIEHSYAEYPGAHTWEYWNEHVVTALEFHVQQFTRCAS